MNSFENGRFSRFVIPNQKVDIFVKPNFKWFFKFFKILNDYPPNLYAYSPPNALNTTSSTLGYGINWNALHKRDTWNQNFLRRRAAGQTFLDIHPQSAHCQLPDQKTLQRSSPFSYPGELLPYQWLCDCLFRSWERIFCDSSGRTKLSARICFTFCTPFSMTDSSSEQPYWQSSGKACFLFLHGYFRPL